MKIRPIDYRTRTLFHFLTLGLLCCSSVQATTQHEQMEESYTYEIGSFTPSGEMLYSSDDEGINADREQQLKEAIMKDLYAIAHLRNYVSPAFSYTVLVDLLKNAREGAPERFYHALSTKNLNFIYHFHDRLLYRIINNYLNLPEVPNYYKKQLKANIRASDIVPKSRCSQYASTSKRWAWCISGCSGLTGTCWKFCTPQLVGSIWTLSCLAFSVFSCARCCMPEVERMSLVRHAIDRKEAL